MRKYGLKPIISAKAGILILGSFPSEQSLERQEYYANRQNQFWKILSCLFDENFDGSYTGKRELLKKHGIALWDVIQSCEREGSIDAAIRRPVGNDLPQMLKRHRGIRGILLNGRKAENSYFRLFPDMPPGTYVPSSSPAHAVGLPRKIREWRKAMRATL